MRKINFYKRADGSSPISEFLDNLNAIQAKKVTWVMSLVEELERVPKQYFKKLESTKDIWEIRAKHGGDSFRVLGFFVNGGVEFLATNGFKKKTNKTPKFEIERAESRKRKYLERCYHE